ncbi:hypothetical protein [Methylibium petroleiphilum]|uniref:hypothetical protein n=1 Tax=Methylibium petroleiphilum TaxID=105560 RepID=UPI003D2708D5
MCTGTEYAIAQGIGAAVSAAGAYKGYKVQQEGAKMARRAEQERKKAEADAAAAANFRNAEARRALRANSLFTGGGTAGSATTPGAGGGQATLGVGG